MTEAARAGRKSPGRIGVLGGTFNPIHLGHLRMAEILSEEFGLDPFIFIPSAVPPHKTPEDLCPADVRLEMVRVATAPNPRFRVSDVEVIRGGASYSVETLESLAAEHGAHAEIFFAMADDAFAEIETWKDWQRLFALTNIIVVTRPGGSGATPEALLPVEVREAFCYNSQDDAYRHESGKRLYFRDVGALGVSSTAIRRDVREGRSIRYLVPEDVRDVIARRGLYLHPDPGAK
ncbi:MAG: nicotinate-nucleotide adenylyltransferase [Myxococcota bacterium]